MNAPYNTYLKPMTRSKRYISNLVQSQAYGYEKKLFNLLLANTVITRRDKNVLARVALIGKFDLILIIICIVHFLDPFLDLFFMQEEFFIYFAQF
jgi:hypothetical protein